VKHADRRSALLLFALVASAPCISQTLDHPVTAYVDGERQAVIGLLPSSINRSHDAAQTEYRMVAAIERTRRCMGDQRADYRVVLADRIVLRSRGADETHAVPMIGVLLVRPGSNARILFAGGGPETLARLLRQASQEYFGESCDLGQPDSAWLPGPSESP
jgi:hypothetical protein